MKKYHIHSIHQDHDKFIYNTYNTHSDSKELELMVKLAADDHSGKLGYFDRWDFDNRTMTSYYVADYNQFNKFVLDHKF